MSRLGNRIFVAPSRLPAFAKTRLDQRRSFDFSVKSFLRPSRFAIKPSDVRGLAAEPPRQHPAG
jgi:hypothetical protein